MTTCAGLSDSPASVIGRPTKCLRCSITTRLGNGLCLNCIMLEALEVDREDSGEAFAAVLEQAAVETREWRLGNYEILEEVGRGGMAVIYRARQRHSRRIVAIKRILSYQADSSETLKRFRREAEAAASLDHPHILPIYEVAEAEGTPFFSMKFATGGSLAQAGRALVGRTREVVTLIAKVTRAIEHAHSKGILHRDIKPGNILLDSAGEPLVSDFGLAKWLDGETDLTRTLTIFGTPGYIAPEQLNGHEHLSRASDVYSIGAVLFGLLAGRPPFLGSHALSVIRQATEAPAPRLRSLINGVDRDLETICARCLEREPHARYQSAGDLAEDLERWLAGRPILARRVLPSTRIWRWSRRNPRIVVTAAVCLALGGAAIWFVREPATKSLSDRLAPPSKRENRQSVLVHKALSRYPVLELRCRHASQPAAMSPARMKDWIFSRLADELRVRKDVLRKEMSAAAQDIMRHPVDDVLEAAGAAYFCEKFVEAERLALQAADALPQDGDLNKDPAVSAFRLAMLAAHQHKDYTRALEHGRDAEKRCNPERDPENWLDVQLGILFTLLDQGRFGEAEELARRLVDRSSWLFGPEDIETVRTRAKHASALAQLGRVEEAEAEMRAVVGLEESILGREDRETMTSIWGLGMVLSVTGGNSARALVEFRRAYELRNKVLGPEDPDTLRSRNSVANALIGIDPVAALAEYKALLETSEKVLGPDDQETARVVLNIGFTYGLRLRPRNVTDAATAMHEATKRLSRSLGPEAPFTIYSHDALGMVLAEGGEYVKAEAAFREALPLRLKTLGPDHQSVFTSRSSLAFVLEEQGRHHEAREQLLEVLAVLTKEGLPAGPGKFDGPENRIAAAIAKNDWYRGEVAKAEEEARRLIQVAEKELGAKTYTAELNKDGLTFDVSPLSCRLLLANTLRDQRKYNEAEVEYRAMLDQEGKVLGPEDPATLETCYNFAYQLAEQGRLKEATMFARRAADAAPQCYGREHPYTRRYRALLNKLETGEQVVLSDAKFRDALVANDPLTAVR